MDTCNKISRYMQAHDWDCRVMGVPKTIDNDLFGTDHCPGFASAAKYIATSCMEVSKDCRVYDTGTITVVEIMGRHAGWLAGSAALAAVGSNGALINLLVNLFVGLALGANVVAARCYGAKDDQGVHEAVQTAVTLSLVGGVLMAFVGFFAAHGLLELMSSPEDVIDLATLYLKIYFIGMPMTMLYNFNASLLRAVGDTRRPLVCLAVAGAINVVLNLVFVIVFQMSVAGVALATILSQTVSAIMVTVLLVKEEGAMHLDLRHLGFHKKAMLQIIQIGLPAGLQSTVFSLSNVVIQSAINSFGSTVVAGNSAASNLEGFIYTGMNAFAQAAVTFTSQNVGARRYDNLDRVMRNCLLCVTVLGLFLGCGAYFGGEVLLHFYSTDEAVVAAGLSRMQIICTAYFLCGIMDTLASCLRGRGYSVIPMIVSLVGSCLLRLVWIATIFRMFRSTGTLYISYPLSWALTAGVHLICLLVVRKKMNDQLKEESRLAT